MADITSTYQPIDRGPNKSILWEALTSTNVRGKAIKAAKFDKITVWILGTISAAKVIIEGAALDTGDYVIPANGQFLELYDTQHQPLSFTILPANPRSVLTIPAWIRPKVTGADGSTDIDVLMVAMQAKN